MAKLSEVFSPFKLVPKHGKFDVTRERIRPRQTCRRLLFPAHYRSIKSDRPGSFLDEKTLSPGNLSVSFRGREILYEFVDPRAGVQVITVR